MPASETPLQQYGGQFGAFTIADVQVALPLSQLRKVIPRPLELGPMQGTSTDVVGAVNLRLQIVPVFDRRRLLSIPAEGDADIVNLVIVDRHVFGLIASSVCGVIPVAEQGMQPLADTGNRAMLFAHTFER